MVVEVIDILAAVRPAIDDHPVPVFQAQLDCQVTDDFPEVGDQLHVIIFECSDRPDGLFGND
jgi:hypothetical protein